MIKRFRIELYKPGLYILILIGCKYQPEVYNDKFYNRMREDKHRILPIRKPYYLNAIFNEPWEINFISSELSSSNVDRFCLDKGYMWGYGKFGTTYSIYEEPVKNLFTYFIVDFDNNTEYISVDSVKYQEKLKNLKLYSKICYSKKELDSMYNDFSRTGKLPWYSEK